MRFSIRNNVPPIEPHQDYGLFVTHACFYECLTKTSLAMISSHWLLFKVRKHPYTLLCVLSLLERCFTLFNIRISLINLDHVRPRRALFEILQEFSNGIVIPLSFTFHLYCFSSDGTGRQEDIQIAMLSYLAVLCISNPTSQAIILGLRLGKFALD